LIVGWTLPGGFHPLTWIDLQLTCAMMTYTQEGGKSKLRERIVNGIPIVDFKKGQDKRNGETEVRIPDEALLSSKFGSEGVSWAITLKCKNLKVFPTTSSIDPGAPQDRSETKFGAS
jgi:hypothetical protein